MKNLSLKFVLTLLLGVGFACYAEAQTVRGGVTDQSGEPIIGASVVVDGTTIGASTGFDGTYELNVPNPKTDVLVVTYIGMKTQHVPVNGRTKIDITLEEDVTTLEDVVVIGYQTVKRKDLTGSVASVTGKDIAAMPVASVAQAMQGKLPGVNVTSQDGRPDATVSIRVRGGGSITQSNDPLILIDGVPGSLDNVPADQVASIDVLKDASSTAIYGARGANGVILVTTKGAQEGKVSVTYNGYVKFNTPTEYLEALNPYEYLVNVWGRATSFGDGYAEPFEKIFGIGRYATAANGGIEAYKNVKTTDMQKKVYNSSFSHNHDITVSGGNDRTKVYFGFNYLDDQGMKLNSYLERANMSLKVNQNIAKGLDIALDTRYVQSKAMSNEGQTNGAGSILSYSYRFRPIATEDIRGDVAALREGNVGTFAKQSMWDERSPYARIADYEPLRESQHLRGTLSLNWAIIPELTYHTDLTMFRTWSQNKTWEGYLAKEYFDDNGEPRYAGDATIDKNDSWGLRWTNTLNYNKSFGEDHRLNVLIGQEVADSGGTSLRAKGSQFPTNFTKANAFAMLDQGNSISLSSGKSIPDRIVSLFARVNYTLMDRYLFTFTFRADGSSKFSPDHRWGYFPAGAFAWRISEEKFLRDADWLDNLKLRLSYGTVGNDGISASLWSQTWASQTDSRYRGYINGMDMPAYKYSSNTMPNLDLKWETTITRNLGIDFGFWNNRLSGSVDVYWNTTKDLLMQTSIAGITGSTSTYANVGQTSNKGVEIALQGVIYQNKDWNVSAGVNINFNKNKVDKLADNVTGYYESRWASSDTRPLQDYVLAAGMAVGQVRGFVYDGFYTVDDFIYDNGTYILKDGVPDMSSSVFSTLHGVGSRPEGQYAYPGMAKYKDVDNSGTVDDKDIEIIGSMAPTTTGGFNLNATFKGIDLGLYFNYSLGNKVYNANKLASLYNYKDNGIYENKLAIVRDAWKIYDIDASGQIYNITDPDALRAANVNAKLPYAYNENGVVSSLGIEDGSFLRLNTITLGYTLPSRITKKAGISNLRIYASIYNVCTITGYSGLDPEVNTNTSMNSQAYPTLGLDWGAYPRPRSYVIGVNLSF